MADIFQKQRQFSLKDGCLKSLGPIDRKFHGHGENDGFVLYEYIINNAVVFANIQTSALWKKMSNEITCQQ